MDRFKNNEIKALRVIVVDENGKKIGEKNLKEAIFFAESVGFDLMQMTYDEIPVCKLGNYNKILYEEKKKGKAQNKSDVSSKIKEVKLKNIISEHDLKTKISQIDSFLGKGNRVQLTIQLNRHQKDRIDIAKEFLNNILSNLSQNNVLQSNSSMREYCFSIILTKKGKSNV